MFPLIQKNKNYIYNIFFILYFYRSTNIKKIT